MPASTPQMSDPRIIVQTYNPPSKNALPVKITPPPMKFNLFLPKPKQQFIINDIHYLGIKLYFDISYMIFYFTINIIFFNDK